MQKGVSSGLLTLSVLITLGSSGALAQADEGDVYRLTANIVKSQDDYATKAFQAFAERVAAHTDNKVIVDVHFGGELGFRGADGLRILANRAVDISEIIGASEGGTVPDIMITTLPFFITSFDEFAFFERLFRPHLNELFAEHNARCLFTYSLTAQHFWNQKPIDTLDDIAGIKMRTYDRVTTDMLSVLGAAPLRVDFTELYTALQQGTVDGMVTSIASVMGLKGWEVVSHANLTSFSVGGLNCLAINLDSWEELPPALQVGVLLAAHETEDELRIRVPELEREGLETLQSHGMVIHEVPADTVKEMRELTAPIRAEFLESNASPELRAIVERYERIRGLK